jgi:hypothetical protein
VILYASIFAPPQDYLICIEMFFASLAFTYAFTHKDYLVAKNKVM